MTTPRQARVSTLPLVMSPRFPYLSPRSSRLPRHCRCWSYRSPDGGCLPPATPSPNRGSSSRRREFRLRLRFGFCFRVAKGFRGLACRRRCFLAVGRASSIDCGLTLPALCRSFPRSPRINRTRFGSIVRWRSPPPCRFQPVGAREDANRTIFILFYFF